MEICWKWTQEHPLKYCLNERYKCVLQFCEALSRMTSLYCLSQELNCKNETQNIIQTQTVQGSYLRRRNTCYSSWTRRKCTLTQCFGGI